MFKKTADLVAVGSPKSNSRHRVLHLSLKSLFLSSIWTNILNACLAVDGVSKILLGHPNQAGPQEESYGHPIVKSEHLENIECTKQMQKKIFDCFKINFQGWTDNDIKAKMFFTQNYP